MSDVTFDWTHHHSFDWESNVVAHIYYNEVFQELWVVLLGGRTYAYNAVTPQMFNAFANSASAGQYYNKNIRQNREVYSLGYKGYDYDIKFVSPEARTKTAKVEQQYEVTVKVTLTTTVRVTAENFDSAAALAMDEVDKIQGCETDEVYVTGVKKL